MTAEQEKFAQSHETQSTNGSELGDQSKPKVGSNNVNGVERTAAIQTLNDRLRREGRAGMIHMTNGVASLGLSKVNAIFKAIAEFSDFNADNDPWGEHDCAVMTIDGERVIWKIDYSDRTRTYHSPDPADPKLTVRVMTVMLGHEY